MCIRDRTQTTLHIRNISENVQSTILIQMTESSESFYCINFRSACCCFIVRSVFIISRFQTLHRACIRFILKPIVYHSTFSVSGNYRDSTALLTCLDISSVFQIVDTFSAFIIVLRHLSISPCKFKIAVNTTL